MSDEPRDSQKAQDRTSMKDSETSAYAEGVLAARKAIDNRVPRWAQASE